MIVSRPSVLARLYRTLHHSGAVAPMNQSQQYRVIALEEPTAFKADEVTGDLIIHEGNSDFTFVR
ncbi:hypothetical protein T265_03466 [Opisthorchis viverrini]|uniref:Uncharacterized protein n=1 Tax=Opisthorchis viverrini TaxID=6198 RepID=A0A074ZS61_OPIVI|nr:hypothetical protein T265_03466 [Opisthorchis viverrini]KER29981.1 hypothetical protein T265_03466 [Opisthorchis viverrini]